MIYQLGIDNFNVENDVDGDSVADYVTVDENGDGIVDRIVVSGAYLQSTGLSIEEVLSDFEQYVHEDKDIITGGDGDDDLGGGAGDDSGGSSLAPTTSPRPVARPDDLVTDLPSIEEVTANILGDAQPIIFDLDGDGVEVLFGENVYFDVDGDGFLENTGWVGEGDGFLVIDLNADGSRGAGDGNIELSNELVFSSWGNAGDTDLQALRRAFDSNNDGILNSQDGVWDELRIWKMPIRMVSPMMAN
tara:strand:+ start:251 stop:988 length:738 start_codon:yes stop_codon:yes gene_type:complete